MSDISSPSPPSSAPPPPSAPAPAAPQQMEVPVNETPVNTPSPIGDQAPPKPPGQEDNKSSRMGRREALQQAFDRAKQDREAAEKEAPKRAKPGMGHNQPPEPIEAEAKKPPEKPPLPSAAQVAERYREGGKFARDPAKVAEQTPQTPPQPRRLDERAPYREPPPRFSEPAKADWASTPESVRGAVDKMGRDFQGFYERARGDHEVMETVRPYHDLAVKQGTTLQKAFENYYGMEMKLRQDLIGGLDILVQNLARGQNLKGQNGEYINLRDVAYHIVNMTPEQHQLTAQRNQQTSAEMRIGQLHQQVDQLSQGMSQLLYQQRFAGTRAEVDKFAEAHPRFDELSDLIKSELDLGFPLEVAYQRADKLRPNTAAQTRNTPAQTRKTSISGAPDGNGKTSVNTRPSDGRHRGNGEAKHPTRREALEKAFRRASNGV